MPSKWKGIKFFINLTSLPGRENGARRGGGGGGGGGRETEDSNLSRKKFAKTHTSANLKELKYNFSF